MSTAGFTADTGTDFSSGNEPEIARRLDLLAKKLGIRIFGISGARTPAHSVEVGGSANDPHTHGAAADIGVNSQLRSSASSLTDAQLASVGLVRPFAGATEINHVQLAADRKGVVGTVTGAIGDAAGAAGKVIGGAAAGASGGAIVGGPGGAVIGGAAGAAAGAVGTGAVKDVATAGAKEAVKVIWGAVGQDGTRALLYALLVIGGVVLAVVGIARATGIGPRDIASASLLATPEGRAASAIQHAGGPSE